LQNDATIPAFSSQLALSGLSANLRHLFVPSAWEGLERKGDFATVTAAVIGANVIILPKDIAASRQQSDVPLQSVAD